LATPLIYRQFIEKDIFTRCSPSRHPVSRVHLDGL